MGTTTRHICSMTTALTIVVLGGCTDDITSPESDGGDAVASVFAGGPPPPAGLADVLFQGRSLRLWPFTGADLAGTASDPVNLLFTGDVDILSLRAALVGLDGDRTAFGFPMAFPFDCTWTDASGGVQSAWTDGDGWSGNPVQLQCGRYDPVRFHLRLFPAGDWVVGAVHMDLLIPDTPEHQVISWELARQLVTVDFLRSGLLDAAIPVSATPQISPAPSYRDIPAVIYDGLPPALKAAIGGPASSGGSPVPIGSSGTAAIINVANRAAVTDDLTQSDFTLPFNQVIPRPICSAGPTDYVLVQGSVRVTTRTIVGANGTMSAHNTLDGEVTVTPFDIFNGVPNGSPFRARIDNMHNTGIDAGGAHVNAYEKLLSMPPTANGSISTHLVTTPGGTAQFTIREQCS